MGGEARDGKIEASVSVPPVLGTAHMGRCPTNQKENKLTNNFSLKVHETGNFSPNIILRRQAWLCSSRRDVKLLGSNGWFSSPMC